MRKLLRDSFSMASNSSRNQALSVKPNTEKVSKWLQTLSNKATTGESKAYIAQLSSLFQFYSKQQIGAIPTIDWDYYKQSINTVDLVDKVQKNYETLISEQYDVERICNQVVSSQSKELEDLENELTFHSAVWATYYAEQTMGLFELEDYGDPNDYLLHEAFDFYPSYEQKVEELVETHNWFVGSKHDINLKGYMISQFNWGKKVISFYRHPADDFKAGRCTKNILGR